MSLAQERAETYFSVFEQQVASNLSCVHWISAARDFIRAARPVLRWEALEGYAKSAITDFSNVPPVESQSLVNSLYVTTAAAFEEFCRLVIHAVCEEFNQDKRILGEEDENLRKFLIVQTSRTLGRLHSPPAHFSLNQDELCSSIGTMANATGPVQVVSEAISDVPGILELNIVLDQLQKLNKSVSWEMLAKDRELQRALGTKKTKETEAQLKNLITGVCKNRNRIAHVGPSSSDVTQEVLQDHANALLAVGSAIVRNL